MFSNIWRKRQLQVLEERRHAACSTHFRSGAEEKDEQELGRVVAEVLSQLKGYLYEKDVEFLPDDDIRWLLGINSDEITDIFERVVIALDYPIPESQTTISDISTVDDLVKELIKYSNRNSGDSILN